MWGALALALVACLALDRIWRSANAWWRLKKLKADLRSQGVKGPTPNFLDGNVVELFALRDPKKSRGMDQISHDIAAHVTPEVDAWSSKHGKPYLFWWFNEPRLAIFDPESIREVLSKKFDRFAKSQVQLDFLLEFLGAGLLGLNGQQWLHNRGIVSPAFQLQKLKMMHPTMKKCTDELVAKWNRRFKTGNRTQEEVEIQQDLKRLTADVISHTAFSSNYEKGEKVFEGLTLLGGLMLKTFRNSWIPFFKYLPTKLNFQIWKLRREIDSNLLSIVRDRRGSYKAGDKSSHPYGNDLLGLILEKGEDNLSEDSLIGECKTFYFAGQETTASLLSWALLLLATYPDWQEKARTEVQEHFPNGVNDAETLSKLKVVSMIIYETLRLYPAATEVQRASCYDTVLSNGLKVPQGTAVIIPILSVHHDPELWGPDVNEFKPERFANGLSQACKHPNAFLGFSFGPRVCIGQAFALMEAKVVLAILLQNFSFEVSPNYRHNPALQMVLHAHNGLLLLIKPT